LALPSFVGVDVIDPWTRADGKRARKLRPYIFIHDIDFFHIAPRLLNTALNVAKMICQSRK
jgi:hypothetical protein